MPCQVLGPRSGRACSWGSIKGGSCQGYGLKFHCMAPPSDDADLLFDAQSSDAAEIQPSIVTS
eukprot:scaffold121244_cov17-Tisochrysis_lutea.AAC.1